MHTVHSLPYIPKRKFELRKFKSGPNNFFNFRTVIKKKFQKIHLAFLNTQHRIAKIPTDLKSMGLEEQLVREQNVPDISWFLC